MGLEIIEEAPTMPLMALNHVSFLVRSVKRSVEFYEEVLGFVSIKRPSSFDFEGAWLFNYGVGIHLLQSTSPEQVPRKKGAINPKDNHISFQCSDMRLVVCKLEEMGIDYVTAVVEEAGVTVDQLFFHDPDGYMIEVCNCHVLPVLPLSSSSCPLRKPFFAGPAGVLGGPAYQEYVVADAGGPLASFYGKQQQSFASFRCAVEVQERMMEGLLTDIMKFTF
ncbi:hypothetical protein Taro_020528 [Colocasia esculenta]|uniref:VOC domain-containing protein n=1 Tax=Colocasia esculenta TaxID=4460 RepID=A0A843V5I1_COLES|nr:hypothetical protein [Colocasia esculenta]